MDVNVKVKKKEDFKRLLGVRFSFDRTVYSRPLQVRFVAPEKITKIKKQFADVRRRKYFGYNERSKHYVYLVFWVCQYDRDGINCREIDNFIVKINKTIIKYKHVTNNYDIYIQVKVKSMPFIHELKTNTLITTTQKFVDNKRLRRREVTSHKLNIIRCMSGNPETLYRARSFLKSGNTSLLSCLMFDFGVEIDNTLLRENWKAKTKALLHFLETINVEVEKSCLWVSLILFSSTIILNYISDIGDGSYSLGQGDCEDLTMLALSHYYMFVEQTRFESGTGDEIENFCIEMQVAARKFTPSFALSRTSSKKFGSSSKSQSYHIFLLATPKSKYKDEFKPLIGESTNLVYPIVGYSSTYIDNPRINKKLIYGNIGARSMIFIDHNNSFYQRILQTYQCVRKMEQIDTHGTNYYTRDNRYGISLKNFLRRKYIKKVHPRPSELYKSLAVYDSRFKGIQSNITLNIDNLSNDWD